MELKMWASLVFLISYFIYSVGFYIASENNRITGPIFMKTPVPKLEFINTNSAKLDCIAHGKPNPVIKWFRKDERNKVLTEFKSISSLLLKHENGSLIFNSFKEDRYIQEIHATTYVCEATNVHGKIISPPATVKASTIGQQQQFQAQVYDEFVIKGNVAILKCNIPTFFKDELKVISWIREDNIVYKIEETGFDDIKVLSNGNLYVKTYSRNLDLRLGYWCQVQNILTKKTFLSQTAGRIRITTPKSSLSPTITDITKILSINLGEVAEIFCSSQGYPPPQYKWYSVLKTDVISTNPILRITNKDQLGTYKYTCVASNKFGSDSRDAHLVVKGRIYVAIKPNILEIKSGDQIKLTCKVEGYPIDKIRWAFNGIYLPEFTEKELEINEAKAKNEGMYQCFASNDYQTEQSTAQVILKELAPSFLSVYESKELQPGPSITIKCKAIGKPIPKILWKFNDKLLSNDLKHDLKDLINRERNIIESSLTIKNVRTVDGGLYSCIASNIIGHRLHKDHINVYGLPIVHKMSNITAAIDEDIMVTCYTSGHPISSIKWQRGRRINTLPELSTDFKNGTLIIRKIKKRISGEYVCVASNGRGQIDKKSVFITSLEKPIIAGRKYDEQSLVEGEPFTVLCNVIRGDEPVEIKWMKDGKNFDLGPGKDISLTKMYSVLQIRSVNDGNSGNYSCVANNSAGTDIITYRLKVNVSPKWIETPIDKIVRPGDNITFSCIATGYPVPSISWVKVKNGEVQEEFLKIRPKSTIKNGILELADVNKSDVGTYSCIASNGVGEEIIADAELIIKDLPKIISISQSLKVRLGNQVSLKCTAMPNVTISWLKNDKVKISTSQKEKKSITESTLVLRNLSLSDEGVYVCQAKNAYGTSTKNTSLQILTNKYIETTSPKTTEVMTTSISTKKSDSTTEVSTKNIFKDNMLDVNEEVNKINKNKIDDKEERTLESNSSMDTYFDFKSAMFFIPAITVIILLIAVIATLTAYLMTKKNNTHDSNAGISAQRTSIDERNLAMKKFFGNETLDRRYGKLERHHTTNSEYYGENRQSGAYEIPDYYSKVRPYATLQSTAKMKSHGNFEIESQSSL